MQHPCSPHAVLGVSPSASLEEIKQAYHRLARQYHPDLHTDPQQRHRAEEHFKQVTVAYQALRDPVPQRQPLPRRQSQPPTRGANRWQRLRKWSLSVDRLMVIGSLALIASISAPVFWGTSAAQPSLLLAQMQQGDLVNDPLGSSISILWPQIQSAQARAQQSKQAVTTFERTPPLRSPDGRFAVYSRLLIQAQPSMAEIYVSSVVFLENLQTGELQQIAYSLPREGEPANGKLGSSKQAGFGVVVPVAWSASGKQLLCRDFQGGVATDFISDYAVIWDQEKRSTTTLAPTKIQYSNAVLLGWSRQHPDRPLFRAGMLGDDNWPQWTVGLDGRTKPAPGDQPLR